MILALTARGMRSSSRLLPIPTCKELIDRIMGEAEALVGDRLSRIVGQTS